MKKESFILTWNQQYSVTNPLGKLNWDVNDEPASLDLIWTSLAVFGGPLTLGTWENCLLHSPSASAEAYQDKGVCMWTVS